MKPLILYIYIHKPLIIGAIKRLPIAEKNKWALVRKFHDFTKPIWSQNV